jgi:hypothetical protein
MQLGELFFSLGFKSEGTGEAAVFNDTINTTSEITETLQDSLNKLSVVIADLGKKMSGATDKMNVKNRENVGLLGLLNQKMQGYFGKMNAARLQIMGVGAGLTYFVNKAAQAAVHIDKISSATGLSTDKLQRLGDMAAQSGSSMDDLAGAVAGFQKNSVDIMLGKGGNIGPFQFLGLNPHDDPLKILDQLSVKLKKMPTTLGTAMAKDLGLSDDLIYFLRNKENLKPTSEETILTDKEIKRLKNFNFEFNRIWEQSKRALQKFAALISPIANVVVHGFDRVSKMFANLTNILNPYMATIEKFMPVITVLGAIMLAAFFPVEATILGLLFVLEDLYTYSQGGDSIFGDLIKYFKELWKTIQDGTFFGNIVDYFKNIELSIESIIRLWYGLRSAMTIGDYSDYYAQEAQNAIDKIRGIDRTITGRTPIVGSGVLMNPPQGNTVNSSITFNIDGAQNPTTIVEQMKSYISSEHRKMEKGQFYEK